MTIDQIEKEFDKEFNEMLSLVEVQTGVSERENVRSFLRSKIKQLVREIVPLEEKVIKGDQNKGWNDCRSHLIHKLQQAGINLG